MIFLYLYFVQKEGRRSVIPFHSPALSEKEGYEALLWESGVGNCEYSFANLFLWGRQYLAYIGGCAVFFSQFNRRSVYPFPIGNGDRKAALDAVMEDAAQRGIPCRLTGLRPADCAFLEAVYPGRFRFHTDRDSFDYVYAIDDLADLKGRKFQKKRNHIHGFSAAHPDCVFVPMEDGDLSDVSDMAALWFSQRILADPHADLQMEQAALKQALANFAALGMKGMLARENGKVIAMALGTRLSETIFDIHFENC